MSETRVRDSSDGLVLDNGTLSVSVHEGSGTFSIESHAGGLRDCAASAEIAGRTLSTAGGACKATPQQGADGVTLTLERAEGRSEAALAVDITLPNDAPYSLVQARVTNKANSPLAIGALRVVDSGRVELGTPAESLSFYKHGWQSWSPTLVLPCAGEDLDVGPPVLAPRTRPERRPGRFLSETMAVLAPVGGSPALLGGFVTAADQLSQVWCDREGGFLTAASYADGIELAPGASLNSEVLLVEPGTSAFAAMERYASELGRRMKAPRRDEVASGWCSWYHFFTRVSELDITRNLAELSAHRDELPIEYVQIDDGYQAEIGDWLTLNEKFPRGMRWLVDRIHSQGYKAGLWLAPFLMGAKSRLYAEHPEWAVQHKPGRPSIAIQNWGQDCYALDLTRAGVLEWLSTVFQTVTRDWGFDYVKIDFIYAGAVDGIRHDRSLTRAQAYRMGLKAIRDAVGDRFILGCGNPVGPSIGLVDGARIGPDVAPYWHPYSFEANPARSVLSEPATVNGIRNAITRAWMHGRLWQNDPDCLMVRATDTALSGDEVRCLATVIGLTGGMVLDSDDMSLVSDERREIISLLLPAYGRAAVAEDLFAAPLPERLALDCSTHRLIAAINWDDTLDVRRVPLPDTPCHVFDAWSREYLGAHSDGVDLEVPPHGCRLVAVRKAEDRPQVVGTSLHLMQGALEIASEAWGGKALTLDLRPVAKKNGEIYVHAPARYGAPAASGAEVRAVSDEVYAVQVELRDPRSLVLEFSA